MKVQTFMAKLSVESLHDHDAHINDWLARNNVEPRMITQTYGCETGHDGRKPESVVITSIWY